VFEFFYSSRLNIVIKHKGNVVAALAIPISYARSLEHEPDIQSIIKQGADWFLKAAHIFGLHHPIFEYSIEVNIS
jgi:hypothetical protein